jgi:hypothetical protein
MEAAHNWSKMIQTRRLLLMKSLCEFFPSEKDEAASKELSSPFQVIIGESVLELQDFRPRCNLPSRNDLTVIQAAQGLACLKENERAARKKNCARLSATITERNPDMKPLSLCYLFAWFFAEGN